MMELPHLPTGLGKAERAIAISTRSALLSASHDADAAHAESEPPLPERQPSGGLPIGPSDRETVSIKLVQRPIHSERRAEPEAAHAEAIAHAPNSRVSADGAPSHLGTYDLFGELGRGVRSVVYRAREGPAGREIALKVIKCRGHALDRQRVRREVELQRKLKHRNIVKVIDSFDLNEDFCVALQLAPNADLLDRINNEAPMNEKLAAEIFQQIFAAIDYAHSENICHRDLKPENVLFDGSTALVCDWGQALEFHRGQTRNHFACGTEGYKAPELKYHVAYEGPELDVWGLGSILYVMVTKRLPYDDTTPRPMVISAAAAGVQIPEDLSPALAQLLCAMLTPAARHRCSMRGIAQSAWFTRMCCAPAPLPPPPEDSLYEPGESEGSNWMAISRRTAPVIAPVPSAVVFTDGDDDG